MTILTYIICILLFLNIITHINIIGKDRKPKTHGEAIIDGIFIAIIIYLLLI